MVERDLRGGRGSLTDAIKWLRYWKSFKWTHAEHFGDLISTEFRWLACVLAAWPPSTSRQSHTCPFQHYEGTFALFDEFAERY